MLTRLASAAASACVAAVLLTACSGGGEGSGAGSETESQTGGTSATGGGESTPGGSGPTPYLPVPLGVVLTDPGSELSLGERATIAWRPSQGDEVGVLDVKVRKLVHADIEALEDWQLDAAGRTSALYFVTVTVTNLGESDLDGERIPLYALAGTGALVESSAFKTDFDPCPSPALPDGFKTGETVTLCQAYLVPRRGDLRAVAFRSTTKFNPITWVGNVAEPQKRKKKPSAG